MKGTDYVDEGSKRKVYSFVGKERIHHAHVSAMQYTYPCVQVAAAAGRGVVTCSYKEDSLRALCLRYNTRVPYYRYSEIYTVVSLNTQVRAF